ncbi:MarR family winged helix-turn-helix transcriptional regulator [Roseibium suaedae]|uniref:Transcriptional regulator, MarR family n=1 Tax=Roseibium suaedae TaxID=735517 RepID=A0A1M6YR96_9HYPH|nr:MarR family transcriptional regulator [Roseibium suaedae]SHL20670.1 transcriptional regulator, MarR family [Roseibium suaedae]
MAVSSLMPGHLIRRLHQISSQVFAQRVKEAGFDLTPVQFAALDSLRHHPGIDQAGLAEKVAKDKATIGAVIERLEQKGLVERLINRHDKRARKLTLTEEGEAQVLALIPVVEALQREILPTLSEAEYQQFIYLAAKASGISGGGGEG